MWHIYIVYYTFKDTTDKNEETNVHYEDIIRKFRIEDNILIGQELPISRESINVSEILLEALKSKPNCIGQVDALRGKKQTYAEISERSIKCALWLKKHNVKPGDIIGLCTDNDIDAILILLGVMYIGAIVNTWDHELSPITAKYFLSVTSPKIVFTIPSSAISLTKAAYELKMSIKIVVLQEQDEFTSFDDILINHDSRDIAEFKCTPISKPEEVALIVLSSGTTGMPKATEISHYSLRACLPPEKITEMKNHVCTWTPTLRWHYGVQLAFEAIMACSTRIIVPDWNNDVAYCEFIEKYKVTWFSADPCMLIRFIKTNLLEKYRLSTLREIAVSGSHFGKEHHEALAKKLSHTLILNGYGSTDSGGDVCVQVKGCKPGSIGLVAPNVRLKVANLETGEALKAHQTGELRIKLPCIMNGYHKNPEATKRAFDSDGWLCTGDLGYYDNDGEVYIIDRISHFILFRSINISPAEIEYVLGTHPAVLHVAVIGIPHEVDEQHPMAVISRVPGKTVTKEELISLVENNMPDHCKLRAGVEFLDELPRTTTGKIAKKTLYKMFVQIV
ncbi:hypothetical protein P5V15_012469 [Pogonomyrmex californicus]